VRLELREIDSPKAAVDERFVGSPTVRVNGRDVDPRGADAGSFGLSCRLYARPDGPSDEQLFAALHAARHGRAGDCRAGD
jgi:hypothetical protein